MMRRNRSHREILSRLWDRLEAVQDEQGWLACDAWPRRRVPDEPRGVLDALAGEFDPQRLVDSGVADQRGDGPMTMSRRLAPGVTTLFPLWEAEGAMPFDALLPDGLLPIDLSGVAAWIPSRTDVDRIQLCGELDDRSALRDAVLESIRDACYELSQVVSGDVAPWQTPDTYLDARSALSRVLRHPNSVPASRSERIETFEQLLQQQVIGPLVAAGASHPDPIQGVLYIAFADLTALLQSQAPFLQRDLIQAGIQTEPRDRRGTLESRLRSYLQLVDRLVRIARELRE